LTLSAIPVNLSLTNFAFHGNRKEEEEMEQARIVFTRFDGDGRNMFNDIYAIDPDGKNETRLTMNPAPDGEYYDNAAPRYNKDRTMIAFVSTKNHPRKLYNIFFMDLANRKTAQVTTGDLNISSVDWAPDDNRLTFSGVDENGLQQVHVVGMNGTGFTRLTKGPSEHMNPMWSPRGDLIAFVEFRPGTEHSAIWIMDPAGGNRRMLTTDEALHANPSWSPDGMWLVYRCDLQTPHLRKINVDTGEVVPFEPPARGADSSPIWSGRDIVFSSNCDWEEAESLFNLYRITETGENLQRLTTGQTYEYCGDW
jgi:Tol biopolymer transport system component